MNYMRTAGEANRACIFCAHRDGDTDEDELVLARGRHTFALMNAFPYNTGHLMVAPLRHVADVGDLDTTERAELFDLTCRAIETLRDALQPDGFNTGMNLGAAAGAGVPGHLHMHVVPRWAGDTNFMSVTAQTKVLPELLPDTYAKLKPLFEG
jgi:ATP adenylyltransferase